MENLFYVFQAEFKTGHVLKKDLPIFITGNDMNEVYQIFESECDAIEYAKKMQRENLEIEYWVKNSSEKTVFYISKNETKYYE